MNDLDPRHGPPHVVPTTCGGSHDRGRRWPGVRLRDVGWVSVGILLGSVLCDFVLGPALASVTARPGDLASLAVFAMLLGSVRHRHDTWPVSARLVSAIPFLTPIRPMLRHGS